MRSAIAFFFSVFFLLLSGNNQLCAHPHHNRICCTTAKLSQKSEQAGLGSVKNSQTQIRTSVSSDVADDAINATDEMDDDDDFIPFRKYIEINKYFLTSYNQISGKFNQYQKECLPFCKHFSYVSSHKYILYRVFRI